MLLSRREVFSPTEEQKIILGHMGYAAFKLWNVQIMKKGITKNWECPNIQTGMIRRNG